MQTRHLQGELEVVDEPGFLAGVVAELRVAAGDFVEADTVLVALE